MQVSQQAPGEIHNSLCSIGYGFQRKKQLDSAEYYFNECLQYRIKYDLQDRVNGAFGNLIYLYQVTSRVELWYEMIQMKIQYYQSTDDQYYLAEGYFDEADFLAFSYDSAAINAFNTAIELAKSSGNISVWVRSLMGIGDILDDQAKYTRALSIYQDAERIATTENEWRLLAYILRLQGKVYLELEAYGKALEKIRQAFEINNKTQFAHQQPYLYATLAEILQKQNKFDEAMEAAKKGYWLADERGNIYSKFTLSNIMIGTLIDGQKINEAGHRLDSLRILTEKSASIQYERDYLVTASRYYQHSGESHKAVEVLLKLREVESKLSSNRLTEAALRYNARFELEKKENENKLLKQVTISQRSAINLQNVIIVLSILLLLIIIYLAYTYYVGRQKLRVHSKELTRSNERIKELNDTKDLLFKVIAHDLKGPVGTLGQWIELLRKFAREGDLENVIQFSNHMAQQSKATYNTLNNLLLWTENQQEGSQIQIEKHDLHASVLAVMDFLEFDAKEKGLTLVNEVPPERILPFDKNVIETVLRNLLANAIKYSSQGDRIIIRLSHQPEGRVRLAVVDTGVGLDEQTLGAILSSDRFVSMQGTAGEKGSGLGLKLSNQMLQMHGSKLEVTSKLGEGSIFSFVIQG